MEKRSKKDIKEAIAKLKGTNSGEVSKPEQKIGKLSEKKSTQRIRKGRV